MAELKIRRRESLSEQTATFDDNSNYKKAISQLEKVRGFKDSDARIEFCNRKIEQINAAVLAANVEKQNRARARADAIHAGAEAIREKLPLIKKVAYVVVPVLIVAILATAILPKIDFSRPKDKGSSMDSAPTTVPATRPEENLQAATQPGEIQPSATQPGETQPVTTQPPAVQQPTPQQPTPQRPTTQQPTPQQPTPQQPSANPVRHEEGCPFNNGMHADLFAKEIGTFHSCQPYPTTDGNGNVKVQHEEDNNKKTIVSMIR